MIRYVGKTLLIDESLLVVGDLHLGYGGAIRGSGVMIPDTVYRDVVADFEEIFSSIGKVDKIILLGDLKHEFGRISKDEWVEIPALLEFLEKFCKEIIIVRGNHDVIADPLVRNKKVSLCDFYLYKQYCFLHGDKDFDEIHDKKIGYWIMGHAHPAVTLEDSTKSETYKCFLVGEHLGKKIVVLPSFFPAVAGTDIRSFSLGLAWDFNISKFDVKIVGENLEVLDFGTVKKLA